MATEKLLLSAEEAADRLGTNRSKIFWLMQSGRLPSLKMGRSRKIPAYALDALVRELVEEDAWRGRHRPSGGAL